MLKARLNSINCQTRQIKRRIWFLGFSYVSLSFIRDLDYLVASALFPGFGVAFQAARTGTAWGSALRDDAGYENAIIQTALLSHIY